MQYAQESEDLENESFGRESIVGRIAALAGRTRVGQLLRAVPRRCAAGRGRPTGWPAASSVGSSTPWLLASLLTHDLLPVLHARAGIGHLLVLLLRRAVGAGRSDLRPDHALPGHVAWAWRWRWGTTPSSALWCRRSSTAQFVTNCWRSVRAIVILIGVGICVLGHCCLPGRPACPKERELCTSRRWPASASST